MSNFFANLINAGKPNGDKLPEWPAAKAGDKQPPVMIIDVNSRAEKSTIEPRYDFLDASYMKK